MKRYSSERGGWRKDSLNGCLPMAIQSYESYVSCNSARRGNGATLRRDYVRERPRDANCLVEYYDRARPGLNNSLDRLFTRRVTKIRRVLDEMQRPQGFSHALRACLKRRRLLVALCLAMAVFPALLSPNHPIAVYAYLANTYRHWFTNAVAAAAPQIELRDYLVCPEQVARYRSDLREAVRCAKASRLFLVVRRPDGRLEQEPIRTWDSVLAKWLPSSAADWLYRKEIPFLGDEVAVWMRGGELEAVGHYHTLGGLPSKGDALAQYWSGRPEIVVVNGVVPFVYLNGSTLQYGHGVSVTAPVSRMLRAAESSVVMDVTQRVSTSSHPTVPIRSFLGYLKDYRGVDISRPEAVATDIVSLIKEFDTDYRDVFSKGLVAYYYRDDLDKFTFLTKIELLKAHVCIRFPAPAGCDHFGETEEGVAHDETLIR